MIQQIVNNGNFFSKFLKKFNFVSIRYYAYSISIALSLISIILIPTKGLNFNIDFTGGVVLEIVSNNYKLEDIRKALESNDIKDSSVQNFNEKNIAIKIGVKKDFDKIIEKVKHILETSIDKDIKYLNTESIGPQMGSELVSSGIKACFLSFVFIMIYIWIRFEWQFGIGVLLAIVHDALICIGFMCVTQLEFNLSSIAAVLTVIGYSVNDSIVIYDRIRDNLKIIKNQSLPVIINDSIHQTLSRTTLTVFTTILANLGLVLLGGQTIFSFSVLVLFGFIFGTYSSIFVSAPFLLSFGENLLSKNTETI